MSSVLFNEWLKLINQKIKEENDRKILLIMDNAPVYKPYEYSNIEIVFLPPNTRC